jgi:hypothetical protein
VVSGRSGPFAGVEYKINDRWTFKAEYSSTPILLEDDSAGLIERDSPYNFGFEYQKGANTRYGVYSLYGTEVGLVFHLILDPKTRATGGVMGAAPLRSRRGRRAGPTPRPMTAAGSPSRCRAAVAQEPGQAAGGRRHRRGEPGLYGNHGRRSASAAAGSTPVRRPSAAPRVR